MAWRSVVKVATAALQLTAMAAAVVPVEQQMVRKRHMRVQVALVALAQHLVVLVV